MEFVEFLVLLWASSLGILIWGACTEFSFFHVSVPEVLKRNHTLPADILFHKDYAAIEKGMRAIARAGFTVKELERAAKLLGGTKRIEVDDE